MTSTTKLVAMVLSTYFDAGSCSGYPSKLTLAAGASLSTKFKGSTAVGEAIDRLEGAGHLRVKRERGRRGWTYFASTNGIPYAALADADLLLIPRLYEGLDEKGNPSPGRPKSLAGTAEIPRRGEGEVVEVEEIVPARHAKSEEVVRDVAAGLRPADTSEAKLALAFIRQQRLKFSKNGSQFHALADASLKAQQRDIWNSWAELAEAEASLAQLAA